MGFFCTHFISQQIKYNNTRRHKLNIKFEDEKIAICFYIAKLNSKRVGYENFLRCWNNRFNEDLYGGKKRIKDDLRQHHKLLNPVQQDKFTELFARGTHLYMLYSK